MNTPKGTPARPAAGQNQMTRTYCEACQYDYRNRPGYINHICTPKENTMKCTAQNPYMEHAMQGGRCEHNEGHTGPHKMTITWDWEDYQYVLQGMKEADEGIVENEYQDRIEELKVKLANTRANWEILNNENSELLARLQMSNNDVDKLHAIVTTKDDIIEGYKQGIKDHLNKAYGRESQCGDTVFNSLYLRHHTCTKAKGHTSLHDDGSVQW